MQALEGRRILLVIGGGIAAYKVLELIRRLKERGAAVRAVLTKSAHHFVTPLSVSAITGERVFDNLFDLDDEQEIGHIRLSREADLIVVAPATADLLAKMAHGLADDLATAVLLATDKPVLVAPAMNPRMWSHPATRRNVEQLSADGVGFVGPEAGEMAERGEAGLGRLAEPMTILAAIERHFSAASGPLAGLSAIVTSGPTHEPIDPVRYLANRSSGRQGHAIAAALAAAGADVTLVSGPVEIAPPPACETVHVETAQRNAGGGGGGAAGAHRGDGGRRRRLARRGARRGKDEEGRSRPAAPGAGRKPRHPGDRLAASHCARRSSSASPPRRRI